MKKHLKLSVALIVIAALIMSLIFFLLYWFFGDEYEDFEDFKQEFAIPGLDDGFIPQGMGNYTYTDDESVSQTTFLVSGYMNKGGASRIYVVEGGESIGYVTVMLDDDTVYEGHGSGIATNGTKVWLCSESTVYVLYYDEIEEAAKENGSVTVSSSFDAYCNASFCYCGPLLTTSSSSSTTNYLYVGEFYRKGNYETDEGHHVTTSAGDENKAVIFRFDTSSTSPLAVYSITGNIQGMAITNGGNYITLSQSYGLSNSHLLTYKYSTSNKTSEKLTYYSTTDSSASKSLTTYVFDSANLVNDYEIPSMSEGLCTVNDRVYVLFESAGDKYKMFVRERLSNVYSVRLDEKKFSS